MEKFSAMRSLWIDLGMAATPRCKCHRSTTWAAVFPYFRPIDDRTVSVNSPYLPSANGPHASACMPNDCMTFMASVCCV